MTDTKRYKNITVSREYYEKINAIATQMFEVNLSKSKTIELLVNLFFYIPLSEKKKYFSEGNRFGLLKHADLVDETVYDTNNHLNSYRYYSEQDDENLQPQRDEYGIRNDRIKRKLSERQSELARGKQEEQCK